MVKLMVEKTQCKDLAYVLLGIIFLPLLLLIVISGLIPISDIESPSFLQLILSRFLFICIASRHTQFILAVMVTGSVLLWLGYFSNRGNLRLLGVISLLGIPVLFISLIYIGFMPIDPYFLQYTDPFMAEVIIIALFVAMGLINALLGKAVVGHFSGACQFRPPAQSQAGKVIGYGLFIWAIWFAILLGILLDYINGFVAAGEMVTLFGITGTRSEWYQNIFLFGIVTITFPTLLLVGYIGKSYNLKLSHTIIVIFTALIIGSAIWDLFFAFFYPLPENQFYWWFDPFGLGFLHGLNLINLTTLKIEGGIILMDTEFMKFFSYFSFAWCSVFR